ncbi:MAG: hypothetical protein LBV12_11970 [Puniceicoccales bacterium]|jgi:Holliday junction resolvase RusA-like endonuclease|nr:hypothetical protein [Puniceicoccales bacterium]
MKRNPLDSEISFFIPGLPCKKPWPPSLDEEAINPNCAHTEKLALSEEWAAQICRAAREWENARVDGPLELTLCFWMPRPASHFSMKDGFCTLREDAPKWHLVGPSSYALTQFVISVLNRVHIWHDVCQLCAVYVVKGFSNPTGCQVSIAPIEKGVPD